MATTARTSARAALRLSRCPPLPSLKSLFQILDLFAKLLDHVLHLKAGVGQFDVVRFRAGGIYLAVEFLRQEIQPPPHRAAFAKQFARLRDMRRDAVELFTNVRLRRYH